MTATDHLDLLFRMVMADAATAEQLQAVLHDATLFVALDAGERPVIAPAPDDVPCVVVATSEAHRQHATAASWQPADLMELITLLPDEIDVLFNPAGPVPFRLVGDFVRDTVLLGDDEIAAARAALPGPPARAGTVPVSGPASEGEG